MKKILIVDNDIILLRFMTELLEKEGYQVETATDAYHAIDMLRVYTPEIIIVDLLIPHVDGEMLCKLIRGMEKLKDVYLIVLYDLFANELIDMNQIEADICIANINVYEMVKEILYAVDPGLTPEYLQFSSLITM